MASTRHPSHPTTRAPSGKPGDEGSPAKLDLRVHVKDTHWSVRKSSSGESRGRFETLFPREEWSPDRMRALILGQIPYLRRYSRILLRDLQAADDLVQETLVQALATIGTRQPDSTLGVWLFTIMKNAMSDNPPRASNGHVHRGEVFDNPPRSAVEGNQEAHVTLFDLQCALDELPGAFKQVVILAGVEGFRYEEVAEILGAPVDTVRSRLSRGRSLLQTLACRPRQTMNCEAAANSASEE